MRNRFIRNYRFLAVVLALILVGSLLLRAQDYAFGNLSTSGYSDLVGIAAPANPATGNLRLYADSTSLRTGCLTSGGAICQPMLMPGAIHSTGNTASITTTTLCAAAAGACNKAGMYRIYWTLNQTTFCATGSGTVAMRLAFTDAVGVAHPVNTATMYGQSIGTGVYFSNVAAYAMGTAASTGSTYGFGEATISTDGTAAITFATTVVACTTGTGTYTLDMVVMRLL